MKKDRTLSRRDFSKLSAALAASVVSQNGAAKVHESKEGKSKRCLIYHNDTRHYYLYVFEPPMSLVDARRPVDEIAGAGVDTLVCHIGDGGIYKVGLFYNTKLGLEWRPPSGKDVEPSGDWWRAWMNLRSLRERGLDPLRILADRAHERGMEFFGSLRMNGGGVPSDSPLAIGGPPEIIGGKDEYAGGVRIPGFELRLAVPAGPFSGFRENHADYAHPEIRARCFAILEEVATGYEVDGLELDFTITPFYFKPGAVKENAPLMTEHVRKIAEMVHTGCKRRKLLAARVFPTEELNRYAGLDVRAWLAQGLVDIVVPVFYGFAQLDPQMPYAWLIEAARPHSAMVYPMLDPIAPGGVLEPNAGGDIRATPAMLHAAAANAYAQGADGVYTWRLPWPLGPRERGLLTELRDPGLLVEADKHYVFRRRPWGSEQARAAGRIMEHLGYAPPLPLTIPYPAPAASYDLPFFFADDPESAGDRLAAVTLRVKANNLVGVDKFQVVLNGQDLAPELYSRTTHVYRHQWLEYHLRAVRPRHGRNVLTFSLQSRPEGLEGGNVKVDEVEILVQYRQLADLETRPPLL